MRNSTLLPRRRLDAAPGRASCPDSHMNSYIRCKLALTEDEPTIKPYMENLWAELPESKSAPSRCRWPARFLHERWMLVLRQLTNADGNEPSAIQI